MSAGRVARLLSLFVWVGTAPRNTAGYSVRVSGRLDRTGADPDAVAGVESTSAPSESAPPEGARLSGPCSWCSHELCPDRSAPGVRSPTRGRSSGGLPCCVGCPVCRVERIPSRTVFP